MNMTDLAGSAIAMKQAQIQVTAQAKMLRAQHDMQMQMIDMLSDAADARKATPPPGTGLRVDKTA